VQPQELFGQSAFRRPVCANAQQGINANIKLVRRILNESHARLHRHRVRLRSIRR
jgi:hypothetical protein